MTLARDKTGHPPGLSMSAVYDLGPFRLDIAASVLTYAGVPVALGSRGVAVLAALVERASEFVHKDAILDAAWPGLVVEENNLAVQISAIRRALAQAPGGDRWIETLARRGYRFVGPVSARSAERSRDGDGEPRSNLPEPLTSFVGRERELVDVKRLLPRTRLLTLVGTGGTGKTRLALQLAAEVIDAYRDGVRFVDLAPILDPALVADALARSLGVRDEAGRPLAEALAAHLKDRQVLLVLDNCEHLIDACSRLVDSLLRAAAGPTVIATSREPLQLAGEQTYPVPPLSLPDPSADDESMSRSEAVQLFVARAQSQQPDFALSAARAPAIAQLCIRLDGIPLALELAAARVRALSIEQINERLSDRFRLLRAGARTALPRQQTLRATLDWSHDLLADDERIVFRRLAIFAGSFALEAAAAVVCDEAIDAHTAAEIVQQLVARSMVVADTSGAGARYRLLETTHAYALEKLRDAGELGALARRHAQDLHERFERAPPAWLEVPDGSWRAAFLPEVDNIRAALDWAIGEGGDPDLGIALAGASAAVWAMLSQQREGRARLDAAAERIGVDTSRRDQARLWLWLGLLRAMEVPAESIAAFERAANLYRSLDDAAGFGYALLRLGGRLARVGRSVEAEPLLAQAQPLLERSGSPKLLGDYFSTYAFVKSQLGDLAGARVAYEKALPLFRNIDGLDHVLNVLGNLAELSWSLGDLEAAEAGYREAVVLARDMDLVEERLRGIHLTSLAGVLCERGELDAAHAASREGLALLERAGCAWYTLDHLAMLSARTGRLANAALIAGYQDAAFAARATVRQVNEIRARERLQAVLQQAYGSDELSKLLAEGASLGESEACRLALEE